MLLGDLKLVLEHVVDIKDTRGETEAIKNYEAKLNDFIQLFEKGEERDIKELIKKRPPVIDGLFYLY
ncbi:Uncharacterised protein [Streptococcus pneumoniae]|nr:Uncharacterised protein [Streptococcus pneumoniae]CKF43767.1 Uncharacterised protein [Streptococcus pneumoniae]CKF87467.1 Uncharacterised protein [Streptococcus pneumoniae]CKF95179.1 Uncharacterised protein [Bacillus paranthracis]